MKLSEKVDGLTSFALCLAFISVFFENPQTLKLVIAIIGFIYFGYRTYLFLKK